jgi:allophanate hydrolase subunit 2
MKLIAITVLLVSSGLVSAHDNGSHPMVLKELLSCHPKNGCEVVCQQPTQRWDSYLKTEGDIEVTYFLSSGVRQLKADMGDGQFTILDTHPELQSCRITGLVADS